MLRRNFFACQPLLLKYVLDQKVLIYFLLQVTDEVSNQQIEDFPMVTILGDRLFCPCSNNLVNVIE